MYTAYIYIQLHDPDPRSQQRIRAQENFCHKFFPPATAVKLSWKQADVLPFSSGNHGSSEAGNFVCQLFPIFFGEQMCNRFFNRRCFFPTEVAAKSWVFLVVPSRSFGKAETQIVFSDPQDMPAPKRGVGLSFHWQAWAINTKSMCGRTPTLCSPRPFIKILWLVNQPPP